jgi:molybdenum cofactor cytidylyltransferase
MMTPGQVTGVILAAGASGRFPPFKAGALLHGKPLLHHCLEGMRKVCSQIIVVGGSNMEVLRSLIDAGGAGPVDLVENRGWAGGMFTSVKAGLARVRTGAAFVLPVDCPLVPPAVYSALLATPGQAVVPAYRGRRGHPVLIREVLFDRIVREPDTSSLRAVLTEIGAAEVDVDVPEVLLDLDTPGDLQQLHPGKLL